jgi:putative membrane protein
MAVAEGLRARVRSNPRLVTAILSALGYVLVLGTFGGFVPIYPELSPSAVRLFAHLIAAINTLALASLLLGWRSIRRGDVRRHRAAMLAAFGLILLFLVVYLWKIGGGFERSLVAPAFVKIPYLVMLFVHIGLSVLAVPVVIHAVVLGLSHSPAELGDTLHPRVGRVAVVAWSLSLFLGILTYAILNWAFEAVPRTEAVLLLTLACPDSGSFWSA